MNTMPNKPDAANPRLRLGCMSGVRGAGSLSRNVRRRALMSDRSEVEAVPREFAPVDFADAFIRVHPWHPCSNWMRSRLAGRGCESGDFCRRVLSDESWIFEQVGGANGDEPVSPVAIAVSVAAHPRRSPFSFGGPAHYMNAITQPKTFRRTSAVKWFGLPLYDIYLPAQTGDIKSLEEATARGVFAVGISAKGIVAIGVLARGMFTFGVG